MHNKAISQFSLGFLIALLVMAFWPVSSAQAKPEVDAIRDGAPSPLLTGLTKTSDDPKAFIDAWRTACDKLAVNEIKHYLLSVDEAGDGLLSDLAILAPDLDILPTGLEGPGEFIWVSDAAAMKRAALRQRDDLDVYRLKHWHDGSVAWLREAWDGLVPEGERAGGVALRHLVMLSTFASNHGRSSLIWNDGIPFTTSHYQRFLALDIAETALESRSWWTSAATLPPSKVSWADRCLIDFYHQIFNPVKQKQHIPDAVTVLYRDGISELDKENHWLGFVVMPPRASLPDDGIFGGNEDAVEWIGLEALVPTRVDGVVSVPEIDWQRWAATGLCLVASDDGDFLFQPEPRYVPADKLEIPVLLIVGKKRAFLCLPGEAPIDFGPIDLEAKE